MSEKAKQEPTVLILVNQLEQEVRKLTNKKDELAIKYSQAMRRADTLESALNALGINASRLVGCDGESQFWECAALSLIKCELDENRFNPAHDEKTKFTIALTAKQLLAGCNI